MYTALLTTIVAACAAIIPASQPAPEPAAPVGIEHVVYDGDQGNIGDIASPDTISVRGTTEADCADMGGTWNPNRELGNGTQSVCERVDF